MLFYKINDSLHSCEISAQEELTQRKDAEQDGSSLSAMEVPSLPSPSNQLVDPKFEESKREAVDEE